LAKVNYDGNLNLMIVAVAVGFGVIPIAAPAFYDGFPGWLSTVLHSGIVGGFLAALAGFLKARGRGGEAVLLKALDALQGERYIRLADQRPANEAFLYGWLANRLGRCAQV
jgi:hypothetical protein